MTERSALVEKCLNDAQEIRECIYYLSTIQERAVLKSFGISCISLESSDDSENNLSEPTNPLDVSCIVYPIPNDLELKTILTESHFNWFQLAETVLGSCLCEEEEREVVAINQLDDFFRRVITSDHFTAELQMIQQSDDAFLYDREECLPRAKQQAAARNGEVVTDSETDDCEDYLQLSNTNTKEARALIVRQRKSIQRKARHLRAKMMAERNFLSRKEPYSQKHSERLSR